MIHDEIASAFFAKLNNTGLKVFKHYSNTAGERVVIQVKANTKDTIQSAQVWLIVYSNTVNGVPNMIRLNTMKEAIENAITEPFQTPQGEILNVEEMAVDGPYIDPQTPQESYLIIRYRIKAN